MCTTQNKQAMRDFWQQLDNAAANQYHSVVQAAMDRQVIWHGHAPIGSLTGVDAFVEQFWAPLKTAFPDLKRETFIFFGGQSNGQIDANIHRDGHYWVTGTGVFQATFAADYLGIRATGKPVTLRWGEFSRFDHGKITQVYFLIDMIDLMQQAGLNPLPASRGRASLYPPPAAADGCLLDDADPALSSATLDNIRNFIYAGLNGFDQDDLQSMGMADYFAPDVHWYGPAGIGACLSFDEFERLHQRPWLQAFPDRAVQNLDTLFAEGQYSGAAGWAGVKATHTGRYLNCDASGRDISFNGLDWWKEQEGRYCENWVFVDMLHLFEQFGVDLLADALRKQ